MRILWFTNTPSNASADFGYPFMGGGWISSLETLITESGIYNLGVCFFYAGVEFKKIVKGQNSYYGIPISKKSFVERILDRHKGKLDDSSSNHFDEVINDFKPDIIHVFGTEAGYGKSLINRFEKVLFHLQGLTLPYLHVYFPLGLNRYKVFKHSDIGSIARGTTYNNIYRQFKNIAERESTIIKSWTFFAGRTQWDNNYVKLLNPQAKYYHCEELLRKEFYKTTWLPPSLINHKSEIHIGTTINPNFYKGLDLLYKVADLLKEYNIKWNVFGVLEANSLNKIIASLYNKSKEINNIVFHGPQNATELVERLQTCHFFVHPSYIDNSPNSVCEAMLLGMPVLSSSVGGVPSLINSGEDGFLFNPYDKYDLAGQLVNLVDNYKKAIEAGEKARCRALDRHSPKKIIESINNIYNTIYYDN